MMLMILFASSTISARFTVFSGAVSRVRSSLVTMSAYLWSLRLIMKMRALKMSGVTLLNSKSSQSLLMMPACWEKSFTLLFSARRHLSRFAKIDSFGAKSVLIVFTESSKETSLGFFGQMLSAYALNFSSLRQRSRSLVLSRSLRARPSSVNTSSYLSYQSWNITSPVNVEMVLDKFRIAVELSCLTVPVAGCAFWVSLIRSCLIASPCASRAASIARKLSLSVIFLVASLLWLLPVKVHNESHPRRQFVMVVTCKSTQ